MFLENSSLRQKDVLDAPWSSFKPEDVAAAKAKVADKYAPATVNKMLSALRGVFLEAWRSGEIATDEFDRLSELLVSVPRSVMPKVRTLSDDELERLFSTCATDKHPSGARDGAILSLIYNYGLRRREIASLNLRDVDRATGGLNVPTASAIRQLSPNTSEPSNVSLLEWLRIRGSATGPLFCPINKGGRVTIRRLSDQTVRNIVLKRAQLASINALTTEDLRRTRIYNLGTAVDLRTVRRLTGFAPQTLRVRRRSMP
jgi:integrase